MDALRRLMSGDDEGHEALRAAATLLIGTGLLMLFVRYGGGELGETWSDLALLIVLLVPTLVLLGLGFAGFAAAGPRPWQAVPIVFGLLLLPLVLYQFIELLNGDTSSSLNTFWIWAVVAAASLFAGLVAGVRFALLLGGIAILISLLGLTDEILPDGLLGDLGTFRGVCMIITALLVALAFLVFRRDPVLGGRKGGELLTAAGIAFVTGAALVSVTELAGSVAPVPVGGVGEASLFWDTVLLVGSLLLIVAGSRFDARGPGYVGAFGLFAFILIAGFDLDDSSPEASILGWPLVLVLLGAAAAAVSFIPSVPLGPGRRPAPGETAVHEPPTTATPAPPPAGEPPPPTDPGTPGTPTDRPPEEPPPR